MFYTPPGEKPLKNSKRRECEGQPGGSMSVCTVQWDWGLKNLQRLQELFQFYAKLTLDSREGRTMLTYMQLGSTRSAPACKGIPLLTVLFDVWHQIPLSVVFSCKMWIFRPLKKGIVMARRGKTIRFQFDIYWVRVCFFFQWAQVALTWNEATPCVLAHGHNDLRAAPLVLHPGMTEGRRVNDLESTESDRTWQVTVERNVPGLKTLSTRSRVGDGNVSTEQPRQTPERAASSHLWSYPLRQLLPPLTPKRWTGHCCGEEGCLAVLEVKKIMQQMFLILPKDRFWQVATSQDVILRRRKFAEVAGALKHRGETRTTKIQTVLDRLRCQTP